jgi:hypothetical protein
MRVTSHILLFATVALVSCAANVGFAQSAYNNAVLADNPAYYWTFDEASGNARSSGSFTGNANTLIFNSNATRTAGPTTGGGGALGNAYNGVNASGVSGMLISNGNLNGGTFAKYAVEAWIRYDGTGQAYFLDHYTNQPALISNFVGSQFELFGGGSRTSSVGTGPTLPVNTWTHVVIGVDSTTNTHSIYFNGAQVGSYSGYGRNWAGGTMLDVGGSAFGSGASFTAAVSDIASHYSVAGGSTVQAAKTPLTYTYTYDAATIANVQLAGNSSTSGGTEYTAPARLNDGLISPSGVANVYAWEPGNQGVIYGLNGTAFAQPGLTIDLGQVTNLDSLEIEYFIRPNSGVQSPSSLDITVDGTPVPTFTDFHNTLAPNEAFSLNKLASVDLKGFSGRFLHLDFRNATGTQGGIGFWTGLSEIRVFQSAAIPEPGSVMIWTLAAAIAFVGWQRRRRVR